MSSLLQIAGYYTHFIEPAERRLVFQRLSARISGASQLHNNELQQLPLKLHLSTGALVTSSTEYCAPAFRLDYLKSHLRAHIALALVLGDSRKAPAAAEELINYRHRACSNLPTLRAIIRIYSLMRKYKEALAIANDCLELITKARTEARNTDPEYQRLEVKQNWDLAEALAQMNVGACYLHHLAGASERTPEPERWRAHARQAAQKALELLHSRYQGNFVDGTRNFMRLSMIFYAAEQSVSSGVRCPGTDLGARISSLAPAGEQKLPLRQIASCRLVPARFGTTYSCNICLCLRPHDEPALACVEHAHGFAICPDCELQYYAKVQPVSAI